MQGPEMTPGHFVLPQALFTLFKWSNPGDHTLLYQPFEKKFFVKLKSDHFTDGNSLSLFMLPA